MVSFTQLAYGLITAAALSQAAPSGSASDSNIATRDCEFSWEKWITDKMDNPEGEHLSVKEAVKASEECRRPEQDLSSRGAADATCMDSARTGSEAAGHALDLFKGRNDVVTVYPEGHVYWHQGQVWFTGTGAPNTANGGTSSSTYNVARGLGWIMDKCTHDGTVGGTGNAKDNQDLLLMVSNNNPF